MLEEVSEDEYISKKVDYLVSKIVYNFAEELIPQFQEPFDRRKVETSFAC
jgi:hypothetical protein